MAAISLSFTVSSESKKDTFKDDFENGYYNACIVGCFKCRQEFKGETKTGYKWILQVEDDNHNIVHKTSSMFQPTLHEKGNLAKTIASLYKCPLNSEAVGTALVAHGMYDAQKGQLDLDRLIGTPVQVRIAMTQRETRAFANVAEICGVTSRLPGINPDTSRAIPGFLVKDAVDGEPVIYNGMVISTYTQPSAPAVHQTDRHLPEDCIPF